MTETRTPPDPLGALLPQDARGAIVTLSDARALEGRHDRVLVVAEPLVPGTGPGQVLRRQVAVRRVLSDPPDGMRVLGVHRVRQGALRRGARGLAGRVLRGGVLVELGRDERPRLIDDIVREAGALPGPRGLRVGSGRTVETTVRMSGADALLKVAAAGSAAARTPAVLRALAAHMPELVPLVLAAGHARGLEWWVESKLPGNRPVRLTPSIAAQAARACARLPLCDTPDAAGRDTAALARAFPERAEAIADIRRRLAATRAPGIGRHGDLWSGNLLVRRRGLSGVVDWDTWAQDGHPGVDMLHLVATEERLRTRRSLGEVWRTRPWTSRDFREVSGGYWSALGMAPDDDELDLVGLAWWAGQLAGDLARNPALARDERWVERNLDVVLT